jgi:glycosyltransferase involved in cell wall biosynthesis
MLITVFTPSYNRAFFLRNIFESLTRQTFHDFEWIVVDDGSTDRTKEVMKKIVAEPHIFPIKYIYKANGGKHTAINIGAKEADGELFFILDSDDRLPIDSLKTVAKYYYQIQNNPNFGGVSGIDGFTNGDVLGSGLPSPIIDASTIDIRYKYKVKGDMAEVFRTEVMREFPFPEISGEKFCPEALVWNRIAKKYKLRFFNKIIYLAEYQNDGLTANIVKMRMKSPVGSMMTYSEMLSLDIPLLQKIKASINFWRFSFCSDKVDRRTIPIKWSWTYPLGLLMHLKDSL